jgi:alkylation response protein AidB-like acyl-CoA dehydrogenase
MEFGLSQEQVQLKDSLGRFLKDSGGLERARKFVANNQARAGDLIEGLASLGITGLIVPEAHGGVGMSLLDAALVAESLGHAVAPAPFIGSSVLAPLALQLAGSAAQQSAWLPRLAAGEVTGGVALAEATGAREGAGVDFEAGRLTGRSLFVLDYEADVYIVVDRTQRLYLVEANAKGLSRKVLKTVDATRPTGELAFDGAAAERLEGSTDAAVVKRLIDVGRVMLAADTLGAAQNMLDQAVAYSLQREQFGRPIGSFQAVKHMCAEMAAALEPCRALVWYAGHALDALPNEASVTAAHAKAHVAEVGTFVARTATEVHGGMGFTDLVGLHYWFKRIGFNRQMLGSPEAAREDAARAQNLTA